MTVRHLISKARLHSPLTFVTYPPATDEEDWTNDYPIAPKYKDHLEEIAPRWRATPLPAFDMSGKLIKIPELEFSLRGSLVLVYFELRHYPIRNKRTNGISGNTFSATATQVKVLERGAGRRSSPYKSLLLKGPTFLPQSPTNKKDQANAVQAFHPGTAVHIILEPFSNIRNCSQSIHARRQHRHGRDRNCWTFENNIRRGNYR